VPWPIFESDVLAYKSEATPLQLTTEFDDCVGRICERISLIPYLSRTRHIFGTTAVNDDDDDDDVVTRTTTSTTRRNKAAGVTEATKCTNLTGKQKTEILPVNQC
jgi:hypothetical protein